MINLLFDRKRKKAIRTIAVVDFSLKWDHLFNPLSANSTKWTNTQTIRRLLQTDCLSVLDHFVGLALKGLYFRETIRYGHTVVCCNFFFLNCSEIRNLIPKFNFGALTFTCFIPICFLRFAIYWIIWIRCLICNYIYFKSVGHVYILMMKQSCGAACRYQSLNCQIIQAIFISRRKLSV